MTTTVIGHVVGDDGHRRDVNDVLVNRKEGYYLGGAYNLEVSDTETQTHYHGYLTRATERGKGTQVEGYFTRVGEHTKITANGDILWFDGLSVLRIRRVQMVGEEENTGDRRRR